MTAQEMSYYVGKKAHIGVGKAGELQVEVWITDMEERWGVVRYQVRPVTGFGRLWVESVTFPCAAISDIPAYK